MSHPVGIRLEAIASAASVKRIQNHNQPIVGSPQTQTMSHGIRGDTVRFAVPQSCADIERVVVIEQIDLRALRRLVSIAGPNLMEIGDQLSLLPDFLIQ